MSETTKPPSPELLFNTINAYMQTAAIKAAIELEIFTAMGEGLTTPQAMAPRCAASERGLRILCDFMVVHGFLTKKDGAYSLTQDSAVFLDKRSPVYSGTVIDFLLSPMLTDGFKDLTGAVRKGGTMMNEGTVAPDNPVWVKFAHAMAPLMTPISQMMAKVLGSSERKLKVLDIAAGHGKFGISVGLSNPNAEITAQDWSKVLEVAKENAHKAGLVGRFRTLPGSAFDVDFGSGYDLILLTNFLHHFDAPTCENLLRKVHAALAPNGRAATLEFVPNEDRVTPHTPAAFSLVMLGSTPSGDAYTFAEIERMFRNAGFSKNELHALPPTFSSLVVSYR